MQLGVSGMHQGRSGARPEMTTPVVATCLLDPRDPVARRHISHFPWMGALAGPVTRAVSGPLAGVSVPMAWLTNMRAISNAPELVALVPRDRRGGGTRMPLGFLRSFLESAPAVEPDQARGPEIVLAHPAEDRWTPLEVSTRFFDRIAAPKKMVVLENAGHYPVETPEAHTLVETVGMPDPEAPTS